MTDIPGDQIRELLATVRLEDFIDVTPAMAAAAVKEMPRSYDICRTGIRREAPSLLARSSCGKSVQCMRVFCCAAH